MGVGSMGRVIGVPIWVWGLPVGVGSHCGSGVPMWVWGLTVGLGSMGGVIGVPMWVWGLHVGLGSPCGPLTAPPPQRAPRW